MGKQIFTAMSIKIIARLLPPIFLIMLSLAACNSSKLASETPSLATIDLGGLTSTATIYPVSQASPLAPSSSETQLPTDTQVPKPTATRTRTPTATPEETRTETPTPSITPTYAILRGTVLEQANCRYGPGAAYLYKYGLYPGYYLEIIGRNEKGTWIVIRAIGGTNPCWVKASLLDIRGDVMSLAPASLPLPQSPYYGPLTGVSAVREGSTVIISWNTLQLRPGDDSLQYPYLVEAWLCQDGQVSFFPIGSWETMVTVQDEPGCDEASHARIYGVEKHGYTAWVNIPWPPP
jgi:hypothetical protein